MKLILLTILLFISSLFACGGWSPDRLMKHREATLRFLPDMWFTDDLRFLRQFSPDRGSVQHDSLTASAEESLWVDKKFHPTLKAARSANSETTLQSAAKTLPQDIALYLRASYLFNHTDAMRSILGKPITDSEKGRFDPRQTYRALILYSKLTSMDTTKKQPLTIRALYMKGRCFQRLLMRDSANACFQTVEQLVKAGASDRLNLAWESMGEQGRIALQRKDPVNALNHYIRQAVTLEPVETANWWSQNYFRSIDSVKTFFDETYWTTVSNSIEFTLNSIIDCDSLAERACKNPAMEFMIASYLYNKPLFSFWDDDSEAERIALKNRRIAIIRKAPKTNSKTRDRFAAAAYRMEAFDLAKDLVKTSSSGLGWWIKAKLAIQKKEFNQAALCYQKAVQEFAKDQPHSVETWGGRSEAELPPFNENLQYIRPAVESAVLDVVRGDFMTALNTIWNSNEVNYGWDYWLEAAYIAERLITTDQLIAFVDSRMSLTPLKKRTQLLNLSEIRLLLARRLMREHRYSEAIYYFKIEGDEKPALNYKKHAEGLARSSGINKAQHLFELSKLTREYGMKLIGYELDPDWGEGDYEYLTDSSKIDRIDSSYSYYDTIYHQIPVSRYRFEPGFATAEEYRRLKATQAVPYRRYHYRWIASDLAVEAAHLVPKRSQAFAAILTNAYWYIANDDTEGGQKIWDYYRKSKPAYSFDTYKVPDWKASRKLAGKQ